MNTPTSTNSYMLIFRNTEWHKGLSAEQMQQISGEWMNWFKRLTDTGKAVAGNPLSSDGRLISSKGGRAIADGPYTESKEAIGGYFILEVASLEEAASIAKECPGLPYGIQVEVRGISGDCASKAKARAEAELAGATA